MQRHVNLVDLVKSFPTNILLQNLASIQKRTSPVKFAHLAKKSGKGSISNLSTKPRTAARDGRPAVRSLCRNTAAIAMAFWRWSMSALKASTSSRDALTADS